VEVPERFLQRMAVLLGEAYPAFAALYVSPPTHGLRVNTLKLTPAQFQAFSPFALSALPYCPAGFVVDDENRPGKHPYHAAGLYYLQDAHAQAVAEILAPQPGERVLDLAAAPGGKTTHLASLMQNQGVLVANEIRTQRVGHLTANLERWGARNTVILNESPERLAAFFGAFFDRVLVDAPCSGEGMFRKDRAAVEGWSETVIAGCAARQTAILHYAARLTRPGGWLAYSTCTFAPEENEQVIARFLDAHPNFELADIPPHVAQHTPGGSVATGMLRLWPHTSPGEGHFVALMRRSQRLLADGGSSSPAAKPDGAAFSPPPRSAQRLYDAFCDETLYPLAETPRLAQVGARLYALAEELPALTGLRVVHPGWWLGNFKKDRFEPAHALAMGLTVDQARRVLPLLADSSEIVHYLRGETLSSAGEDGWLLVAVACPLQSASSSMAFPLGWGKRVRGLVKNHYPRGWQWL